MTLSGAAQDISASWYFLLQAVCEYEISYAHGFVLCLEVLVGSSSLQVKGSKKVEASFSNASGIRLQLFTILLVPVASFCRLVLISTATSAMNQVISMTVFGNQVISCADI